MDRNKKHFIIWKVMMLIPILIGIWFIYIGWNLNDFMGPLLVFAGIMGIIMCGVPIFCIRYKPKENYVARSVGGTK